MLEWYRVGGDADAVMRDVEELVGRWLPRSREETPFTAGTGDPARRAVAPMGTRRRVPGASFGSGMADENGLREALTRRGRARERTNRGKTSSSAPASTWWSPRSRIEASAS